MPSNSCALSILVDKHLAESVRLATECLGNLAPEGEKKRRERRGLDDGAVVIVIAIAEAHHLAVCLVAVKVKRPEWELRKLASERLLLFSSDTTPG
jgi:hypothetical protein